MKNEKVPKPDISDIAVLSLGTGSCLPDTKGLKDAGAFKWIASGALIGTMMDGTARYLQAMVDDLYHRLENAFPEQYVRVDDIDDPQGENAAVLSAMDDPQNVQKLKEIGGILGKKSKHVIRDFVDLCLDDE